VADALQAETPWRFSLPISSDEAEWAAERLADLPRPLIAVHAGARWETKRWPADKFAQIVIRAARTFGCGIVIVGSPAERHTAWALKEHFLVGMQDAAGAIRDLTGRTTLKQLAGVLRIADIMLANDSGPMHLGAALGTPVVGLFTCTDPVRSGPSGQEHILVASQLSCAGSYQKICPHRGTNHLACFDELSVERVWHAVQALLARQLQRQDRRA
jgi:ADP-heptose:LPS heptosyltransferase